VKETSVRCVSDIRRDRPERPCKMRKSGFKYPESRIHPLPPDDFAG
jgi:hypothetical protein